MSSTIPLKERTDFRNTLYIDINIIQFKKSRKQSSPRMTLFTNANPSKLNNKVIVTPLRPSHCYRNYENLITIFASTPSR